MKLRDAEARRLEDDYLMRVRSALAGRPEAEIAEIVQSIRDHIDESAPEGAVITLGQIAVIIERLGPPDAYRSDSNTPNAVGAPPAATVPPAIPPVAATAQAGAVPGVSLPPMPSQAPPSAGARDYVNRPFEFGCVFADAGDLWGKNILPLLLASLLFDVLSVCSLGILMGPLMGGIALMTLRAVEQPESKMDIGDMFRVFGKFWPLLGLFLIQLIPVIFGLAMCFVPGVMLMTIWCFATYVMIERGTGVIDSLRGSFAIATAPGRFLTNFLLVLVTTVILIGAGSIPHIGEVISLAVAPLAWMVYTLAYVRQTRVAGAGMPAGAAVSPNAVGA